VSTRPIPTKDGRSATAITERGATFYVMSLCFGRFATDFGPAVFLPATSGVFCIERSENIPYNLAVPSSTEASIEEIIAKIRDLCGRPFSLEAEAELRKLARDLRHAIKQHVRMAKSSLSVKGAAINEHDPDAEKK
jgi:hypothetical protein